MPKKVVWNVVLLNAVSTATSVVTPAFDTRFLDNTDFQLSWTGTTAGSFTVESSTQFNPPSPSPQFDTQAMSTPITATGVAGTAYIALNQGGGALVRLRFTRTSGTGTLTVTVSSKEI